MKTLNLDVGLIILVFLVQGVSSYFRTCSTKYDCLDWEICCDGIYCCSHAPSTLPPMPHIPTLPALATERPVFDDDADSNYGDSNYDTYEEDHDSGSNVGLIVGCVVGGIVLLCLKICICYYRFGRSTQTVYTRRVAVPTLVVRRTVVVQAVGTPRSDPVHGIPATADNAAIIPNEAPPAYEDVATRPNNPV